MAFGSPADSILDHCSAVTKGRTTHNSELFAWKNVQNCLRRHHGGEGAVPKNIIIFSDGTGQAGGINFDEARTNVYKRYRACRGGPDTRIDPSEQVAFYVPGVPPPPPRGHLQVRWLRTLHYLFTLATRLGIT